MKNIVKYIVLLSACFLLQTGKSAAQQPVQQQPPQQQPPQQQPQSPQTLLPQLPSLQPIWIHDVDHDTLRIAKSLRENMPIDPDFNTNREFTLVGRRAHYALSMGAVIRVSGSFESRTGEQDEWNFHLNGSNIVFNFVGQPKEGHTIGAFIGLAFSETNGFTPQLDHAYLKYNSLTLGRTYTTYNDPIASLFTIDFTKPVASGTGTGFLIRWEPRLKNWRFGVGLEQVRSTYTYANPETISGENQRIPDAIGYVSYEPSDKWHLRLSGVFRGLEYEKSGPDEQVLRNVAFGWGLKLTGHFDFYPVKGYWMVQGGKGSASFQSGNYNMGMDLIPLSVVTPGNVGMQTVWSWGATLGFQVNWIKNLFSVFKASYLENTIPVFASVGDYYVQMNRYMTNVNANLMWNINKLVRIGAEYSMLHTCTTGNKLIYDHRVWVMMYVSF